MSLWKSRAILLAISISIVIGTPASAAPFTTNDLVVLANTNSSNRFPNVYHLDATGDFQGFFFSPFAPTDIAVDHTGRVLFASSGSGVITMTDQRGAFLGFISTPVASISGLAVAADGTLVVNSGRDFYRLNADGSFVDLVFSPVMPSGADGYGGGTALGLLGSDTAVFSAPGTTYSSPIDLVFFNLTTRAVQRVQTPLRSLTALDVAENGEIFAAGSDQSYSSEAAIFRLDSSGLELHRFNGPSNVTSLAVANLPEPGTAVLLGIGLSFLGSKRRRSMVRGSAS